MVRSDVCTVDLLSIYCRFTADLLPTLLAPEDRWPAPHLVHPGQHRECCSQLLGPLVVLRQPSHVVLERVQSSRGQEAGLAHASAHHLGGGREWRGVQDVRGEGEGARKPAWRMPPPPIT